MKHLETLHVLRRSFRPLHDASTFQSARLSTGFVLLQCLVAPLVLFSSGSPGPTSPMAMVDMAGRSRRRKNMRRTAAYAALHALHSGTSRIHVARQIAHESPYRLRSVLKCSEVFTDLRALEVSASGCFRMFQFCSFLPVHIPNNPDAGLLSVLDGSRQLR